MNKIMKSEVWKNRNMENGIDIKVKAARLPSGSYFFKSNTGKPLFGNDRLKRISVDSFVEMYNKNEIHQHDVDYCDIKVLSNDDLLINIRNDSEFDEKDDYIDSRNYNAIKSKMIDDKVPFGVFQVKTTNMGITLLPIVINQDNWIDLDDSISKDITDDIDRFVSSREYYHSIGLLHKRGILLFGSPGNGKTMLINHVIQKYSEKCRVLFFQNDNPFYNNFDVMQKCFKGDLTVFVFEELTNYLTMRTKGERDDGVPEMLNFLDGKDSWDDCLVLATTNYPERIPGNMIARPSRFDRVIEIGPPCGNSRKKYLEIMLGKENVYSLLIEKTKGLSFAQLKEACLISKIGQKNFISAIIEMKERSEMLKKSFMPDIDKDGAMFS